MDFWDLLQSLRAQSIADLVVPDEAAIWRQYCRKYSKTFHTPLHAVFELDPEHVVLSVLEDNLENAGGENLDENIDDLLERIYAIEDPNYESMKAAELAEIDKQIEEEEAERVRLNKPLHAKLQKILPENTLLENKKPEAPKIPPSGGINLSYLAEQDSADGGFED
jgi:hypothetical protein